MNELVAYNTIMFSTLDQPRQWVAVVQAGPLGGEKDGKRS